jgi:hypothetical protein
VAADAQRRADQATIAALREQVAQQEHTIQQLRRISGELSKQLRPAMGLRDADVAEAIMKNLRKLDAGLERYCRDQGVGEATFSELVYSKSIELPMNLIEGESYSELRFAVTEPEWTVKTTSGITVTYRRVTTDPASYVKKPSPPVEMEVTAPPVETVFVRLVFKNTVSGHTSMLSRTGVIGRPITYSGPELPYDFAVTVAGPYSASGCAVTFETREPKGAGGNGVIDRSTLRIARGEKPSFVVAGEKAVPIQVTVVAFEKVVSSTRPLPQKAIP